MELEHLAPDSPRYPTTVLRAFSSRGAPFIAAHGNLDLLRQPALALFCSIRCPGRLILRTYDLAVALREAGVPVISGFHSPMERECFALLLRGRQPLIACPARSIEGMRLPAEWRQPVEAGRLLV